MAGNAKRSASFIRGDMRRFGLVDIGASGKGHLSENVSASNLRSRGVPGGNPGSQTFLPQVLRVQAPPNYHCKKSRLSPLWLSPW